MSDVRRYIQKRKKIDKDFADGFDTGYEQFKIGMVIKELRIKEGMTQEELAEKLHTKKSVISRMENHSEDIRLSTLNKVAEVFGKKLQIAIE
jgi:HTH-type transcriptional regulator/antitoxin HipB